MTKNVNKIMAFASCGLLLLLTAIVVKLMVGVDSLPVLFFLLCFVMSVVAFLCYNITKRRMDGASWSALFVSEPCFDVLMLMAFVPQGRRIKLNFPSTAYLSSPHSIPLSVVLD